MNFKTSEVAADVRRLHFCLLQSDAMRWSLLTSAATTGNCLTDDVKYLTVGQDQV
jgi:hypothetical protein